MSIEKIFLIALLGFYILILFITGLLAFFYNAKHKIYTTANKDFQKQVSETFNQYDFNKLPEPIKTVYKTKPGEDIYIVQKLLVDISEKSKKEIKRNKKDVKNNVYGVFKNNYKLFPKNEKEFFENQIIYLSNKRIVFEQANKFVAIALVDLLACYYAILGYSQKYEKILFLETASEKIKIISNDLQLGLLITQFIKKGLS